MIVRSLKMILLCIFILKISFRNMYFVVLIGPVILNSRHSRLPLKNTSTRLAVFRFKPKIKLWLNCSFLHTGSFSSLNHFVKYFNSYKLQSSLNVAKLLQSNLTYKRASSGNLTRIYQDTF